MPHPQQSRGSFLLFRAFGIDVSLHWTWLLIAYYEFQQRKDVYQYPAWALAEYLSLFLIVLLHEFGHALACRSVGGVANRILLWPFGGVAFVNPPQRPGATLWSIVAGPLVNVILIPITYVLAENVPPASRDLQHFLNAVFFINTLLLVFNLLPIYPLDGGQILRSLLWFIVGQARSLMVAAIIGLVGAATIIGLAAWLRSFWLLLLAALGAIQCWNGLNQARALLQLMKMHHAETLCCPSCGLAVSPIWSCVCGNQFDFSIHGPRCPRCGRADEVIICPVCGQGHRWYAWRVQPGGFPVVPIPPQPTPQPYVPPSPQSIDR